MPLSRITNPFLSSSGSISTTDNANAALRITQLGTGNSLLVEDATNPDSTPFVVDATGAVVVGATTSSALTVSGAPQLSQGGTTAASSRNAFSRWDASATGFAMQFGKSRSGTVGTFGIVSSGDSFGQLQFFGDDGTAFIHGANITASVDGTPGTNDMPGRLVFSTTADGASTPTERMRIDSSGNVGVGTFTTSIAKKLTVVGEGNFTDASNNTRLYMGWGTIPSTGGSGAYVYNNDNTPLVFGTSNTERMRIDSSGNLGINTSSPQYKLDVQSNVDGPIVRVINNRDTTGSFGIKVTLGVSGGAGTTGSAHFHGNTNAVGNWYLYGNGTTSYSSDQRLKKNIESARDGYLEDLAKLRVVKYNWNVSEDSTPKELGLIAQEVEQVFPGLVQDDANPVAEGDDTVYKQLKQSVLPFMLLKAIQELKAINDTQAETINALTARVDAQAADIAELKTKMA